MSGKTETVEYVVKKKDNMSNIVKRAGFPPKDWKKIYEADYNKELRKQRPDPNLIYPGDVIRLPRRKRKENKQLLKLITRLEKLIGDLDRSRARVDTQIANVEKLYKKAKKQQAPDRKEIKRLEQEVKAMQSMAETMFKECRSLPSKERIGPCASVFWFHAERARFMGRMQKIQQRLSREKEDYESMLGELRKIMKGIEKDERRLRDDLKWARKELKRQ